MSSPFDVITRSPIMQLANLARAGQNPMGLIQQLSGQNAICCSWLFPIS